ncbi:MAG: TVP38/TMEM64 family protein [Luteolibacter sp.]
MLIDDGMRLVYLMVGLGVFFLLGWMLFGEGIEAAWDVERVAKAMESTRGWAWAVGILLLVADLLLPVPGTVVMSALGAVYGVWLGGVFAAVGSFLAGLCGYGVGRFFDKKTAKRWLGEKDFERGGQLFDKGGGWVVAVSRALPILPEVISCMAGLVRMPFGKFYVALACGSVPMGFLFAWIGQAGIDEPVWGIGLSMGVPAALWAVGRFFVRSGR